MNQYADLTTLKSSSFLNKSDTNDDVYFLGLLEAASRAIDTWCKRHFYVFEGTRYFDGRGEILLLDDILSITTLKADADQDGTFENSYTANTDYELYPLNSYPKLRAEISSRTSRVYSDFNCGVKKGIEIVGVFGHGDGESATPYADSGAVVNTGGMTNSITTHALATGKGASFAIGQTIRIDTEQMYISGISTDTLTVKRGINGTTAAAHLAAAVIYIYKYPELIKLACLIQTMRWWARKDTAFQNASSSPELGQWISYKELDPDVRMIIHQFHNERF
jgi:hypothetical protein